MNEWIEKAKGDWGTASRELRAPDAVNFDAVCFHAQQCVEKYLKARLTCAGIAFPRTHELGDLLDLLMPVEPLWQSWRTEMEILTGWAVEVRYPGLFATREMAERAVEIADKVRSAIREAFDLPPTE